VHDFGTSARRARFADEADPAAHRERDDRRRARGGRTSGHTDTCRLAEYIPAEATFARV
jgi:hypothetical protein